MDTALELHDSILAAVVWRGATLVLQLRPAYVHCRDARTATGWRQDVDLLLRDASSEFTANEVPPVRLSDGVLDAGGSRWDNLIPLPLRADGPVHINLHAPNGFHLIASGSSVEIVATGEAVYMEKSPWDGWRQA